jgi:outer membrane protein insertion porin family
MSAKCGSHLTRALLAGVLLAGARAEHGFGQAAGLFGQRIVAIEVDCAAPIDTQYLLRLMPMRVGNTLSASDVEEARWRLSQTDIFTEITIDPQPRDGGVAVIVHLVRKSIVDTIRFRGNEALSNDDLRRLVRLREAAPFSNQLREESVARIRERYEAEGFPAVHVEALVCPRAPGEVDVTFDIDEGASLRITAVVFEGEVPVAMDAVRKAAGIKAGDRYSRSRKRAAEAAIVRLLRDHRYYEVHVDSRWESLAGNTGVLHFNIVAGPLFVIEFSGNHRFSDEHLRDLMDLSARPIITDGTWRELARRAQRAYQEQGYYFARVTLHIEAGPPKIVRFDISEGEVFHVAAVEFEGNRTLPAKLLRASMAIQPPSWIPWRTGVFLDDVFDDDLKRLWYLYRRHGFESAEIVDTHTDFNRQRGTIVVTVVIEEGPRTFVHAVERVGIEPIAARLPAFEVKVGMPLDPEKVEADRQALLKAFTQAGYTDAAVTVDVQTKPRGANEAATVRQIAVPGEQRRVGTIIVQGNIDTRSRVILRQLPFRSGAPLDLDALLRAQNNIYGLGLFRSVTVRPLEHDTRQTARDIGVSVFEKPPGSLQWGFGYNTRDGFRGFGEISYANLQGLGRRLSLRGELNYNPGALTPDEYVANLGLRLPYVGDTRWVSRLNLVAQRSTRAVDQFSLERVAFIPAIERTLLPSLRVGLEGLVEQGRVFNVAEDVVAFNPRDEGSLRTISFGPIAVYDARDDPFVPRRGVFDSLRLSYAPSWLGSDVPFLKITGEHSHYIPLRDDVIFVYAARGGWARALEDGEQVPIRERFFLGGRTTVRGYAENSLGPTGSVITNSYGQAVVSGNPTGGDLALNLNTELRFPLVFGLGGVVFVDGGGVYLQDRPISIDNFRRSAGLGLRYITPVGSVSLEYGFKLDRRATESVGEVYFSIGNIF